MMKNLNKQLYERNLGLLLIRVGTGFVFFMHGVMKLQNLPMINAFFTHLGLPVPTAMCIALLETIGGLGLIFGVFTRVFAFLFGIEMLVALFLTHGFSQGWTSHELEAYLIAISFGLVYTGSGRFSIWHLDPKVDR